MSDTQTPAPAAPITPAHPLTVYGPFIISLIVLGMFGASMLGKLPNISPDAQAQLNAAVMLVIGYWIGSSAGSAAKNNWKPTQDSK